MKYNLINTTNKDTDYIQIKINNSQWVDYKRAYLKSLEVGEARYIKFIFSDLMALTPNRISLAELRLKNSNGEYLNFTPYVIETTAFNQTSVNEGPAKIIDNDLNTKWASPWDATSEKYLQIYFKNDTIKLGVYNTLELYAEDDDSDTIPVSFDIMISIDGNHWTTIVSETNITPFTNKGLFYTTTLDF